MSQETPAQRLRRVLAEREAEREIEKRIEQETKAKIEAEAIIASLRYTPREIVAHLD